MSSSNSRELAILPAVVKTTSTCCAKQWRENLHSE